MPAANESQKPTAITSRCSRVRIASPPPTMTISASASQPDIGPHQKSSGSARSGPRSRKQTTSPMFDGLKMCEPPTLIRYFESSANAAVPTKIHQPLRLHQSPCSRARDPEDERHPVPGEQGARGPQEHLLPPQGDPDLEHRARRDGEEDLGDREPEVEGDLAEHLQRRDHHGEVQPRVAQLRQQHRVRPAPDRERQAAGGRFGVRAHHFDASYDVARRANGRGECPT